MNSKHRLLSASTPKKFTWKKAKQIVKRMFLQIKNMSKECEAFDK